MKTVTGPIGTIVLKKRDPVKIPDKAPVINERLIHLATSGCDTKQAPPSMDEMQQSVEYCQRKAKQRDAAEKDRHAEVKADIELGKRVAASLANQLFKQQLQAGLANNILTTAVHREQNAALNFVNVGSLSPRDAAKRIASLKDNHSSEYDFEPIDVADAFKETTPLEENQLDDIHRVVSVMKRCDNPPNQVRFVVPNHDLPMLPFSDSSDLQFKTIRYVNMDSMPEELKSVIAAYLSSIRSSSLYGYRDFKRKVVELADKLSEMPDDDRGPTELANEQVTPTYDRNTWQALADLKGEKK